MPRKGEIMPEDQRRKIGDSNRALGKAETPTKPCGRCKKDFPREEFLPRPNGYNSSYCKPCRAAYGREYHQRRRAGDADGSYMARVRERNRAAQFKIKYGLTLEEYEAMKIAQGNACAICGNPPNGHNLYVDHDHATGVVRALLCRNCNAGVGYFADDPARMRAAAEYVERFINVAPGVGDADDADAPREGPPPT